MILDTPNGPAEVVRKPGDFRRRGQDGPPLVKSLDRTRKPKGNKPELIAKAQERGIELPDKVTIPLLVELLGPEARDDTYARPSGLALDNAFNLIRWKERKLVEGINELYGLHLAVDWDDKSQIDGIVARAYDAAQTHLKADRGTFVHKLVDHVDRGWTITTLVDEGEALGIPAPLQARIAEQWAAFRERFGLVAVHIEQPLVHDRWRAAGTCDRIDRVDFAPIVTPFGTVGSTSPTTDGGQVTP